MPELALAGVRDKLAVGAYLRRHEGSGLDHNFTVLGFRNSPVILSTSGRLYDPSTAKGLCEFDGGDATGPPTEGRKCIGGRQPLTISNATQR